jgi:FlaA1/EpsC-like NDP-sugar epimerase
MSIQGVFLRKVILFVVDTLVFFSSLYLALFIRRYDIFTFQYFLSHVPTFIYLYLFFIVSIYISGLYDIPQFNLKFKKIRFLTYIVLAYLVFGISSFYLLPSQYSPKTVLLIQSFLLLLLSVIWRLWGDRLLRSSKNVKAIILDETEEGNDLKKELLKGTYGIDVLSDMNINILKNSANPKQELSKIIHEKKVELIIADIKNEEVANHLPLIYSLSGQGIKLYDLKYLYQFIFRKMPLNSVGYFWFYENVSLDTKVYEFFKRIKECQVASIKALAIT